MFKLITLWSIYQRDTLKNQEQCIFLSDPRGYQKKKATLK